MPETLPPSVPAPPPAVKPLPQWALLSLSYGVLLVFFVALIASIKIEGDLRTMMFQATIGLTTGAVIFWFQSSASGQKQTDIAAASSAKKDDIIAANSVALATSVPADAPSTTAPSDLAKELDAKLAVTPA